jgi:hypothetical protein
MGQIHRLRLFSPGPVLTLTLTPQSQVHSVPVQSPPWPEYSPFPMHRPGVVAVLSERLRGSFPLNSCGAGKRSFPESQPPLSQRSLGL